MSKPIRTRPYLLSYLRRIVGILGSAGLVGLLWYLFVDTRTGQIMDTLAMFSLAELNGDLLGWDQVLLREVYWFLVLPTLAIALLVALYRRRFMLACRMSIMVVFSVVAVQILKRWILTRPSLGITYQITNSFPSGHTAIAAAGAAALIMVSAARWRQWLTHLMACYLVVVGMAVTVAKWHRPSDVLGAICVVLCFTLLLTPIEDDKNARPLHDAQGRRKYLLTPSSFGALLFGAGAAISAWVFCYIRDNDLGLRVGNITDDMQELASQHAPLALILTIGSICLLFGLAWMGMGEVAQLSRNRKTGLDIHQHS